VKQINRYDTYIAILTTLTHLGRIPHRRGHKSCSWRHCRTAYRTYHM